MFVQQISVNLFSDRTLRTINYIEQGFQDRLFLTPESTGMLEQALGSAKITVGNALNLFSTFGISQDGDYFVMELIVYAFITAFFLLILKPCKYVLQRWQRWAILFISCLTIGILYWQLYQSSNLQPPLFNDLGYRFESDPNLLKARINILIFVLSGLFSFTIFTELKSKKWLKYVLTIFAFIILFVGQNLFLGLIYSSLTEAVSAIDYEQPKNILKLWFLAALIMSLVLAFRQITFFVVTNKHKFVLPINVLLILIVFVLSAMAIDQSQARINKADTKYLINKGIEKSLLEDFPPLESEQPIAILESSWKKSDLASGRLTIGEISNSCSIGSPISCTAYESQIGKEYLQDTYNHAGIDYFKYLYRNQGYEAAINYGENYFAKEFSQLEGVKYPSLSDGFLGYATNWVMVDFDPFWTQEKQDVLYDYQNSIAALYNPDLLGKFGISTTGKIDPNLSNIKAQIMFNEKPYDGVFYLTTKFAGIQVKNGVLEIENVMVGEYADFAIEIKGQAAESYLAENWPEKIIVDGKEGVVDLGLIEIKVE